MPSVDELLNVAEVIATSLTETNDIIEIDADTRTMMIPETERVFGVMSDEKGERKYFRCKRFVGNGIDLSKLSLRVIFQNASGLDTGKDKYIVTDLATDGEDYITFSWELSRKVTAYKGIISFIVCAIKTNTDGTITNEWNTTIANGLVLEGLEANGTQEQEQVAKDYYNQLEAELLKVANEQKTEIEKKAQEVIGTIPSDYTQTQKDIGNLKEELTDGRTDVDGEVHKNIGDAIRGQVRKLRENLVVRQKEQPTDPNNNVWISDEDDEVEVPDMGEFNSLKEDIHDLESGTITPDMTDFISNGSQLFNYKRATLHLYYDSTGGVSENPALSGYFIKVKPGSKVDVNGGNIYGASLTFDMKWIESYINQADGSTITLQDNAEWLYVSIATSQIENIVICYSGNTTFWLRDYSAVGTNLEGATPYAIYEYTYIKKQQACCNQGSDSVCAYYAGVDCKTDVNIISCSWVWEKGTNTGTLALIINPNGIKKISDITNLSLHLQVRNNYIALDILGQRFDKYYYQEIIHQDIPTMALDNKTEHTVTLIANTSNNMCSVIIDDVTYSNEFIPDSNITSISQVLGPYATFEHYSNIARESTAMPQVTYFMVRKDDDYIVYDNFKRQDGQLQNTPQGQPYYLLSTLNNHG